MDAINHSEKRSRTLALFQTIGNESKKKKKEGDREKENETNVDKIVYGQNEGECPFNSSCKSMQFISLAQVFLHFVYLHFLSFIVVVVVSLILVVLHRWLFNFTRLGIKKRRGRSAKLERS